MENLVDLYPVQAYQRAKKRHRNISVVQSNSQQLQSHHRPFEKYEIQPDTDMHALQLFEMKKEKLLHKYQHQLLASVQEQSP